MKSFLSFLFTCICSTLFAQSILWQNTLGGNFEDIVSAIVATPDGGVLVGGYSNSSPSGDRYGANRGATDVWLVRLNVQGDTIWQRTIGGDFDDKLAIIHPTIDGGFVLGITSNSGISGEKDEDNLLFAGTTVDYWIVKISATGAIQWQNTIGGEDMDIVSNLYETSSGDILVAGSSSSNTDFDKTEDNRGAGGDMWVVMVNGANGTVMWDKTIGGNADDQLLSIMQTADGGYILGGFSISNISGEKAENNRGNNDYWVLKLDATRNIVWQKTYGGSGNDFLKTIQQTADGGYIVGGVSDSPLSGDKTTASVGNDYWVLKLNALGAIQWQRTIGGNGFDELNTVSILSDGSYLLGGSSDSPISGDKTGASRGGLDYWIVKLNAAGTSILYQKTIGGNAEDNLKAVSVVGDNYWLAGSSKSGISGEKTEIAQGFDDYWVVRLAANGAMFPGDAYNDFNANHYDLLPIGAAFNEIGVPRANNSILWQAQPTTDWTANALPMNRKYIDSNGDGTINAADTTAILRNYGHTHNGSDSLSRPAFAATTLIGVPLSLEVFNNPTNTDTVLLGASRTVGINVRLGTAVQPAQNVYGVAFSLHYDATVLNPDSTIRVEYIPDWFGTTNEVLTLMHDDRANGILDIAFTRTDHTNVSGSGIIARIYVVIDNINGKGFRYLPFAIDTAGCLPPRLVDSVLNNKAIAPLISKTIYIKYNETSTNAIPTQTLKIRLSPNPISNNQVLQIQAETTFSAQLDLVNLLGQTVFTQSISTNTAITLPNVPAGLYSCVLRTAQGNAVYKLLIE